ncbi:MAG TPA: efflux transporter outer membrane subunit [Alphaproteobacteria bacterium]|nr:efflux transporter outer membrane subunit [Alphaproteobacteria bacterium]
MGCALLTACAVGPDYEKPVTDIPDTYKEQQGIWKPAAPQDMADKGPWWSIYNDAILNDLEKQIVISNQNLKLAEASYRQARALADEARASLFPTLGLSGSATRGKAANKVSNSFRASADATWEPDIWGRIRRDIESSEANAEASAADLANARLSAQAELAADYFQLRAQDEIKRLLDETVAAYQESLKITQNQYKTGIVAKTDVMQAETQLKSTQSSAINLGVQRAKLEHAIAVLIGKPPGEFSLAPTPFLTAIPQIPAGVPSTLLERRPDIASAERQVAAANADIGVAMAAFFPTLTLDGSFGFASSVLSSLITAPTNVWSVGPALALTLFDGGLRASTIEEKRAAYDAAVANYRQTALAAFQDVEDQLSSQRLLAQQADAENETVKAAQESAKLARNQYKAGIVSYTSVVVAEAASLSAQQSALGIRRDRLVTSVNLIKALGGGWSQAQIPADVTQAESSRNSGTAPPPSMAAVPAENPPAPVQAPKGKADDALLGMGLFGL